MFVVNNTIHPLDLLLNLSGSRKLRLRIEANGKVEVKEGDVRAIKANAYCKHLLRKQILSIVEDGGAKKAAPKAEVEVTAKPEPEEKPKRRGRPKRTFDKVED
jgi:hypothetical protein